MSRPAGDGARVIVTARCRRRGHELAWLIITTDGQRQLSALHHRPVPRNPEDPEWDRVFGAPPSAAVSGNIVTTPSCPCGRPHVVTLAVLEPAAAAGESLVFIDAVRDSPCDCLAALAEPGMGHRVVRCREPGCTWAWFRPRCGPASVPPRQP